MDEYTLFLPFPDPQTHLSWTKESIRSFKGLLWRAREETEFIKICRHCVRCVLMIRNV